MKPILVYNIKITDKIDNKLHFSYNPKLANDTTYIAELNNICSLLLNSCLHNERMYSRPYESFLLTIDSLFDKLTYYKERKTVNEDFLLSSTWVLSSLIQLFVNFQLSSAYTVREKGYFKYSVFYTLNQNTDLGISFIIKLYVHTTKRSKTLLYNRNYDITYNIMEMRND